MTEIISFGEWVQTRRNLLHYSRKEFADLVGCAPITVKKIERDERRPSVEMAELIALHLQISEEARDSFVRRARGEYIPNFASPDNFADIGEPSPKTEGATTKADKFEILGRLTPLPDQKLFGVEEKLAKLLPALREEQTPWIIALDGIGGIGKTTMAHALVNQLLDTDEFDDYGWVSAKQEEFSGRGIRAVQPLQPALDEDSLMIALLAQLSNTSYPLDSKQAKRIALSKVLRQKRCLVVIDNLETVTDYEALLPLLRHLASPSKFLLTSRMSLKHESDVASESLNELAWPDARAFLKHEGTVQGLPQLQSAGEGMLKEIYQTAGGNPLALKLVIGQTHFLPIDQVLAGLRLAQTKQSNQLYYYIYREAWEMLDENARKLWVSMPIVPNGTFEQLTVASQLSEFEVQGALSDLNTMSLIEIGPGAPGPRYKLHRLTETFLMHEVIKWQALESSASEENLFFKTQVGAMVSHWQNKDALVESDSERLDQEREGILKAIHLALAIPEGWQGTKELILALTRYMERRGNWQEWEKTLEVSIDVAKTVGDGAGEIRMLGLLGRIFIRQNKNDEAIRNYRKLIRLARNTNNKVEEARACSNLGYILIDKEQYWRSEVISCHALDIFTQLGHQHGLAHTNNHLGWLFIKTKEWEKAESYFQTACQFWEEMGDASGLQMGVGNLGILYNHMGLPQKAIPMLEKHLSLNKAVGDQTAEALSILNLAIAYEQLNQLEQALEFAEEAERRFKYQNDMLNLHAAWETIGLVYLQMGKFETAHHYLESSLSGFISLDAKEAQARLESHLLRLYLAQDQWDKAKEKARALRELSVGNVHIHKNQLVIAALADFDSESLNRQNL